MSFDLEKSLADFMFSSPLITPFYVRGVSASRAPFSDGILLTFIPELQREGRNSLIIWPPSHEQICNRDLYNFLKLKLNDSDARNVSVVIDCEKLNDIISMQELAQP